MKKTHHSNHSQAGYTLVELMLYFALVSILFIQLTSLFITVLEAKKDVHAVSQVDQDGQYIYSRLLYDIARADTIIEPASLGQTSNTLRLEIGGVEYRYHVTDGMLVLTENGQDSTLQPNSTMNNFQVTRLGNVGGNHSLRLRFEPVSTITETSGQESRVYQTAVGVR